METACGNKLEEERKIRTAVNWMGDAIQVEGNDPTYKAFSQMMEYRKEIATKYLYEKNEADKKILKDIFDHCNNQIRNILGV